MCMVPNIKKKPELIKDRKEIEIISLLSIKLNWSFIEMQCIAKVAKLVWFFFFHVNNNGGEKNPLTLKLL